MAAGNTTRYAVLGMLGRGPKSGYDIRAELRASVAHFWSESFGQIYPVLQRLAADGLAEAAVADTGRAGRKVYRLTAKGQADLERWLAEPVRARPVRHELLLKLWFGARVPVGVSLDHVRRYRAEFAGRLATYRRVEAAVVAELAADPDGVFYLLTLRLGLKAAEAVVAWCDEALAALAVREAGGRPRRGKRSAGSG
jgi:DNA-binding PadR family transcriptional regulator